MDEKIDLGLESYAHALMGAVLERLCVPFLLLASDGRILLASALSEQILADGRQIARERGRLVCRTDGLKAALTDFLGTLHAGAVEVHLAFGTGDPVMPLYVTLSPFTPPPHPALGSFSPVAVMFIRDGEETEAVELARRSFKLTPAEVLMVGAVLRNQPVKAFAEERAISVNTARKQLSSVMRKTGVGSQMQLQSLIGAMMRVPK